MLINLNKKQFKKLRSAISKVPSPDLTFAYEGFSIQVPYNVVGNLTCEAQDGQEEEYDEEEEFQGNRQPWYHFADIGGVSSENESSHALVIQTIQRLRHVLRHSVEFCHGELLFTALEDVSEEANEALQKIPGLTFDCEVNAEPGDPHDLMQ